MCPALVSIFLFTRSDDISSGSLYILSAQVSSFFSYSYRNIYKIDRGVSLYVKSVKSILEFFLELKVATFLKLIEFMAHACSITDIVASDDKNEGGHL
jgi:hypothetical protein